MMQGTFAGHLLIFSPPVKYADAGFSSVSISVLRGQAHFSASHLSLFRPFFQRKTAFLFMAVGPTGHF
jgi:hypothetical protein